MDVLTNGINRYAQYKMKYFFMFMMIMWVARTTPLTSFKMGENPFLTPVYLCILIYYLVNYCKLSFRPLVTFVSIYLIWYVAICVKYGNIQPIWFTFLYNIVIVHIAFNIYNRYEFINIFEDLIVKLCGLSLVVWLFVNLFTGLGPQFMHAIAVYEDHPPTETNSIIVGMGSQFTMGLRRNIGFTWEPGRFSCFIIFAMFLNLIKYHFTIRGNKHFLILLLSLISTFSTTGYVAFGIVVLFYIMNTSRLAKSFTIILSLSIVPIVFGLSFIGEKLENLQDVEREIRSINYHAENGAEVVCPQRFASLYFETQNLVHDFWLGYNQNENSYVNNTLFTNVIVTTSQGLITIMAKYGFILGLFFYYYLFKSARELKKIYSYKGTYIFVLLFMLINISYDFWENCIFMYFYLIAFYNKCSPAYTPKRYC